MTVLTDLRVGDHWRSESGQVWRIDKIGEKDDQRNGHPQVLATAIFGSLTPAPTHRPARIGITILFSPFGWEFAGGPEASINACASCETQWFGSVHFLCGECR